MNRQRYCCELYIVNIHIIPQASKFSQFPDIATWVSGRKGSRWFCVCFNSIKFLILFVFKSLCTFCRIRFLGIQMLCFLQFVYQTHKVMSSLQCKSWTQITVKTIFHNKFTDKANLSIHLFHVPLMKIAQKDGFHSTNARRIYQTLANFSLFNHIHKVFMFTI